MTYGNFYVGKGGFQYKKSGGGGNHRIFSLSNVPASINNTFVPGSGVGASSIANRRAKLNRATICTETYPCSKSFSKLGLAMRGGSNVQGINSFL